MRKIILLAVALLFAISVSAQHKQRQQRRSPGFMGWHLVKDEPEALIKRNEVKLNLPVTIFFLHPEITYERIISEDFGVGGSLGFNPGSDDYPIDFMLAPFARWYFGGSYTSKQRYGAGFFVEMNGGMFYKEEPYYELLDGDFYSGTQENVFGAGLGIAIGWKYVTANNWVADIYYGIGRDFVNSGGYPRIGITIGRRF